MRRLKTYRLIITAFFTAVLCTTFFVQSTGVRKRFSARFAEYSLVVKSPTDSSSSGQRQSPFSSTLVSEEEEETHLKSDTIQAPELKSFVILASLPFLSPSLFFDEHFLDVTSPPPWA